MAPQADEASVVSSVYGCQCSTVAEAKVNFFNGQKSFSIEEILRYFDITLMLTL